jgi:hypothetical protein
LLELKVIIIDKIADLGDQTGGGHGQSLDACCDFFMQSRLGPVERSGA